MKYRYSPLYLIFLHFVNVYQFCHASSQSWDPNGLFQIGYRYGSFQIRHIGAVGRTYFYARRTGMLDSAPELPCQICADQRILNLKIFYCKRCASVILRPFKKIPVPLFPQFLVDVNIVLNFQCRHLL